MLARSMRLWICRLGACPTAYSPWIPIAQPNRSFRSIERRVFSSLVSANQNAFLPQIRTVNTVLNFIHQAIAAWVSIVLRNLCSMNDAFQSYAIQTDSVQFPILYIYIVLSDVGTTLNMRCFFFCSLNKPPINSVRSKTGNFESSVGIK